MADVGDFVFPEPWWDLRGRELRETEQREALAQRLRVETARGHPLFAVSVNVMGRCTACDDVLYDLGDARYAIVHLTWTANPPDRPPWPSTAVYESWVEARRAVVGHEPFWE